MYDELAKKPIFFERNRVFRVYKGGKLFHDFFGDEAIDDNMPEEWVASCVKALNKDNSDPREGLSIVKNTNVPFKDVVEQNKKLMLGERENFDVLVKILDSSIRLPIQAHPDPDFSKMYFDSNFGKTEMWLVLATRENAKISFGFKSKITKEDFIRAIEESKENKSAMDSLLYEIPVKKGDVFLIPAKAVHAIGAGCMILEVQEPTDFTIQPEYWCGDYRLNDYEMYLGLSQENALKVFDFNIFGNIGDKIARKYPKIIEETQDYIYESLVFYDDTPCFSVNRYHIKKSAVLKQAPAIYIITEGEGVLEGEGTTTRIKKGDYFFLPYCNKNQFQIKGEAQAVECLPRCK